MYLDIIWTAEVDSLFLLSITILKESCNQVIVIFVNVNMYMYKRYIQLLIEYALDRKTVSTAFYTYVYDLTKKIHV
jgi:hypothetical protein